ncbi:MAG TPA: DUF1707 domain-containing protein [Acidimicrobiales bacterium]
MPDRRDMRIGDAERNQAIDMLRSHVGAGRLTLDEFADLAGQVFAARTYGELDDVGRNLPPGLVPEPAPAAAGTVAPGATVRPLGPGAPRRRRFVAVMCGSRAAGRWRAAPRIWALAFCGSVHIDLREAEIDSPVVDIRAWALMGSVAVTVPPGVRADVHGLVVMGGTSDRTRPGEPLPGAPVVRLRARGVWGGVAARTKRTRAQRAAAAAQAADTASDGAADLAADAAADPAARGRVDDGPGHLPGPLELPRRILDDLALTLPRFDPPIEVAHQRSHPSPTPPAAAPPGPPRPPDPRAPGPPRPHPPPPAPGGAGAPGRAPSGTLTMMVTDIAGSTGLAERLGDRRWAEVLRGHDAVVREQVASQGGTEVKAQGDGFLVVFPSARRAILAAIGVQRALHRHRDERLDEPLTVRIGLHTGEIVERDGDVYGQHVIVASRLTDQAAPGEIVVSALTRDLTASGGDLSFGPGHEVRLKGLSQAWRVHRVLWSPEP